MLDQFTLSEEQWEHAARMGGKNSWMNNDHPLVYPITYNGHVFRTVEAAYKFAKFQQFPVGNKEFLSLCTDVQRTAQEVRDAENNLRTVLKISDCWEEMRYGVMHILNREKYLCNPELAEKLIATHPHPIVEVSRTVDRSGKPWGDRYWGVCVGDDENLIEAQGCNAMGRIAMHIRDELRSHSK